MSKNIDFNQVFLIDQLSNSMNCYSNSDEFADHLHSQTGIKKNKLKNIFNQYWNINSNDRVMWSSREWEYWLENF
jgi:hypothetical protein